MIEDFLDNLAYRIINYFTPPVNTLRHVYVIYNGKIMRATVVEIRRFRRAFTLFSYKSMWQGAYSFDDIDKTVFLNYEDAKGQH
jgi:hypothetical protein